MEKKKTEYYIFVFILLWCVLFSCVIMYENQKRLYQEKIYLKPTFDSCVDLLYNMK